MQCVNNNNNKVDIFFPCLLFDHNCSKSGLTLFKEQQTERRAVDEHWWWMYDLRADMKDKAGTSIAVYFTTSSAEVCVVITAGDKTVLMLQ